MSEAGAHSAIVMSAFVVGGIYGYRWLTGGQPGAKLSPLSLYAQPLTSPEGFMVAWGFTYLVLAGMSAFAPTLAGALALLIAMGDVLVNLAAAGESATKLEQSKTRKEGKKK